MKTIDVLMQGHGLADIAVLEAKPHDTLAMIVSRIDLPGAKEGRLLFLEDIDGAIDADAVIEELLPLPIEDDAIGPLRIHVSHCRHVEVSVRFNGETKKRNFSPSATIERVRRWAARRAFQLSPRDAAEHVLQLQSTTTRPDRDVHVGTLTQGHSCTVAFDLVPCQRVEGET
jgi:hypothetical protein